MQLSRPDALKGVSHKQRYLSRVTERYALPAQQLKRGMIVEASYKPEGGDVKKYVLLILDPNYKNYVHALSLDHVKPEVLDKMARRFGVIPVNKKISTFKQINVPKLYFNKTPQQFYSLIREDLDSPAMYNHSYRTFILPKLSGVFVLSYTFSEDIEKKFKEAEW